MPIQIEGTEYLNVLEVAEDVGVSRQTLWRWRKDGLIPQGNRFRGRKILFSPAEVEAVREFAFRVEPIHEEEKSPQVSLFDRNTSWRSLGGTVERSISTTTLLLLFSLRSSKRSATCIGRGPSILQVCMALENELAGTSTRLAKE